MRSMAARRFISAAKYIAASAGGAAFVLVVRATWPPIQARRLLSSMEEQEGGNYCAQCDRLLLLGPDVAPVLIKKGLRSKNVRVRNGVVEVLGVFAQVRCDRRIDSALERIAADEEEEMTVRQSAATALFDLSRIPPRGWTWHTSDSGHMWLVMKDRQRPGNSGASRVTGGPDPGSPQVKE